jgi:hypothetical protein
MLVIEDRGGAVAGAEDLHSFLEEAAAALARLRRALGGLA